MCQPIIVLILAKIVYGANEDVISRAEFFSPQDHALVKLSPDGKWVAYIGNYLGVPNVYVQKLPNYKPKLLTKDSDYGILSYEVAYDNKSIIYQQGPCLYATNVYNGITKVIYNGFATILATSYKRPCEIVVGINTRNPTYNDVYLIDIRTGERKLLYENNCFPRMLFNDDLQLKIGYNQTTTANVMFYYFKDNGQLELIKKSPPCDLIGTKPVHIEFDGVVYWIDNENVDKAGLVSLDPDTKERRYLYRAGKSDVWKVYFHPTLGRPLWVYEFYVKPEMVLLDLTLEPDFKNFYHLTSPKRSYTEIQMSLDTKKWLISIVYDNRPTMYCIYDKSNLPDCELYYLFSGRDDKKWMERKFSVTYAYDIVTSDGMCEMCYFNIPPDLDNRGKPIRPLPTLVWVHGGPNDRNSWDFADPFFQTQFYADRYVVMRCNFRGSTGYGKAFANAGNGEWGRKMQQDITDAVEWSIRLNFTDPKRVGIIGGSYGGYSVLAGITFTPELYTCAAASAAPSNLITASRTIPDLSRPLLPSLNLQMSNDPFSPGSDEYLRDRSPIFFTDRIKTPLLMKHGDFDRNVDKSETEQMIDALKNTTVPVTFVRFPDEGHWTVKPANTLASMAIADEFFGKCFDGNFEPLTSEIKSSSAFIEKYNTLLSDTANLTIEEGKSCC